MGTKRLNSNISVATGNFYIIQGCHLSSTSKFPDFSLLFSLHFTVFHTLGLIKNHFLVFILKVEGANFFTSNLGVALNGRNLFAPQESKFFPLRAAPIEVGD